MNVHESQSGLCQITSPTEAHVRTDKSSSDASLSILQFFLHLASFCSKQFERATTCHEYEEYGDKIFSQALFTTILKK